MLAPALIVLALLSIFPFYYLIAMSLSKVGLIGGISLHWTGLDNWSLRHVTRAQNADAAALVNQALDNA